MDRYNQRINISEPIQRMSNFLHTACICICMYIYIYIYIYMYNISICKMESSRQPGTLTRYIIIYHAFLPTPRRGSHVKSDKTHTPRSPSHSSPTDFGHQHPSGHTVLIHSFHMPKLSRYSLICSTR